MNRVPIALVFLSRGAEKWSDGGSFEVHSLTTEGSCVIVDIM